MYERRALVVRTSICCADGKIKCLLRLGEVDLNFSLHPQGRSCRMFSTWCLP